MTAAACAPGALPLLGHIVPLWRDPLRFLSSLPALGDLVQIRIGPLRAVVVCDPLLTRQVLLDDRVFDKGGPLYDRGREVIGNGLVSCPHSQHRRQRRLIQPAFGSAHLARHAEVMVTQISALVDSWRDGQVLDVLSELQTLAAHILMRTMLADALTPIAIRQALDDFDVLLSSVYQQTVLPPAMRWLPTPGNRRFQKARSRLRCTLGQIVARRRGDHAGHDDVLSALLTARDSDDSGLSDAEITDQVLTFFGAGADTSASTLAWALHLLARHPDVERRLHTEVDSVLAGAPATLDRLPELELTGQIIAEALRLYPPAWMFTRVATEDTRLGASSIAAGTTIIYSPFLIHHRPDLFPEPERFAPDRWSGERFPVPREAFIPFGGGARKCIGDQFGLTEATLALATIATRWRLHSVPGNPVRPAAAVLISPRGLYLRLAARQERECT